MHRTPEDKLIEINKSLMIDNAYLRGELNVARTRLVAAGQTPFSRDEAASAPRQGAQAEHGSWECTGQVVGVLPVVQTGRSAI